MFIWTKENSLELTTTVTSEETSLFIKSIWNRMRPGSFRWPHSIEYINWHYTPIRGHIQYTHCRKTEQIYIARYDFIKTTLRFHVHLNFNIPKKVHIFLKPLPKIIIQSLKRVVFSMKHLPNPLKNITFRFQLILIKFKG